MLERFLSQLAKQSWKKTYRTLVQPRRLIASLWVARQQELFTPYAETLSPALIREAQEFSQRFYKEKSEKLKGLPISGGIVGSSGGGGGNEKILYFLVRYLKPNVVVETGVSAGASTRAILEALNENGYGHLYSSDLATLLRPDQVGILVPEHLRKRWTLFRNGDEQNIPEILQHCGKIDIAYYDSRKTKRGKEWFLESIEIHSPGALILFDDIDRDGFFRALVRRNRRYFDYRVFGAVGVVNLHRLKMTGASNPGVFRSR